MKHDIDYTLYLVTDRELMSTQTIELAVESAINGGCTLVQLREKTASSREFLETARSVKSITDRLNVPLIINDRVDIALAVDADGVHVGQSDIPAGIVRKLIGPDKVLGVSASCLSEAAAAVEAGADYLGIGAMFATGTKADADLTSMEELRKIRNEVSLPIVVIGGINKNTAPLFAGGWIDGLAVVSAVLSPPDIEAAARELKNIFLTRAKQKIEAVIFDMDGTLIDSMGVWEKIDVDFLTKRGLPVPPDYAAEICGFSFYQAAEYTIRRFGLSESVDTVINEWNAMAAYEYAYNIRLKPYAGEYLEDLKARGMKLGIATSLPAALCGPVLDNNGIRGFFDAVCTSDEVKRGKEFPDIFLQTAQKLDTHPENCVVFEDLPQAVLSAKRAGMTVYCVYDQSSKEHWERVRLIADGAVESFKNVPLFS